MSLFNMIPPTWLTLFFVFLAVTPLTCSNDDTQSVSSSQRARQFDRRTFSGQRRLVNRALRVPEGDAEQTVLEGTGENVRNSPTSPTNISSNRRNGNKDVSNMSRQSNVSRDSVAQAMSVSANNVTTSAVGLAESTTQGKISTEQWHNRMRAKNTRLFMIQRDLALLRGWGGRQHHHNMTNRKLTNLDAASIRTFVQRRHEETISDKKYLIYNIVSPSCNVPPRTHKVWHDPEHYRLYFPVDRESKPPQSRMEAARLRIYKKVSNDCNCKPTTTDGHNKDDHANEDIVDVEKSLRRTKRLLKKKIRQKSTRSLRRSNNGRQPKNKRSKSHRTQSGMIEDEADEMLRVTVYWFRKPLKRNSKAKKQLAGSTVVSVSYHGWVEIDIKTPVQRWMKRPNKNFGVEIRVENSDQRQINPRDMFTGMDCSNERQDTYTNLAGLNGDQLLNDTLYRDMTFPNLEIAQVDVTDSGARPKRHTSQSCVLEKAYFTFEDLGSNWIIAPLGIDVGYCYGHCLPVSKSERYDIELDLGKDTDAYKGCCGPTELKPFTFLHVTENNRVALSYIPDFLVTKCGCRD